MISYRSNSYVVTGDDVHIISATLGGVLQQEALKLSAAPPFLPHLLNVIPKDNFDKTFVDHVKQWAVRKERWQHFFNEATSPSELKHWQREAYKAVLASEYSPVTVKQRQVFGKIRFLLADDMRLGKTYVSCAVLAKHLEGRWGDPRTAIVSVPNTILVPHWINVLGLFGCNVSNWYNVADRASFFKNWKTNPTVLVMTHAAFVRLDPKWSTKVGFIVVDEAHKGLRNRNTKMHSGLKKASRAHKLMLTGTPVEKSTADVWPILSAMAPQTFTSFWRFASTFSYVTPIQSWYDIKGARNDEVFKQWIMTNLLQRKAADVGFIRDQRTVEVEVKFTLADKQVIKDISKEVLVHLPIGGDLLITEALTRLIRVRQVYLGIFQEQPNALLTKAMNTLTNKCVVFTTLRGAVDKLKPLLEGLGIPTYQLTSKVKQLDEFNAAEDGVLLATVGAGGVGTQMLANTIIFLDLPWTHSEYDQATARVVRDGVPSTVYILGTPLNKKVYDAYSKRKPVRDVIASIVGTLREQLSRDQTFERNRTLLRGSPEDSEI